MDEIEKLINWKPTTFKEKIEDLWFDVSIFYEKYFTDPIKHFIDFLKNSWKYRDILCDDFDWDYEYLLNIEHKKLEFMEKYFNVSRIAEGNEITAKEIKLAKKLLEIAGEINYNYGPESHYEFPGYINIKNYSRFLKFNLPEELKRWEEREDVHGVYISLKNELRKQKAWYLYNKIRTEKLFGWWD